MSTHWNLSEVFVVRHAGFPFDLIESLGFSDLLQDIFEQTCEAEDQLVQLIQGERDRQRVRAELVRGQEPRAPKQPGDGWDEALEAWRETRQRLVTRYQIEYKKLQEHLHVIAASASFQEAVFLSNPSFYENMLRSFLSQGELANTSEKRRVERQIYKYLQRFCAKNETTSFFGPIAYGEIAGSEDSFSIAYRTPTQRRTMISYWALRELNRALCRETSLRLFIPLWRSPLFHFNGTSISAPEQEAVMDISPLASRLLTLLDQRSLSLIEASRILGVQTVDVLRAAAPLLRCGALVMEIPLPRDGSDGLKKLLTYVQTIPRGEVQQIWFERLQMLNDLRTRFEQAPLEERRQLLPRMEDLFTEWTGKPARRKAGQMYADRLILNEEASSPFSLQIGRHLAENIARRLSPALDLSAAYGARVQDEYRRQMLAVLSEHGGVLTFLDYASRARSDSGLHSGFSPFPELLLQPERVEEVSVPADIVDFPSEGGRYTLPDICLAAPSAEALAHGQGDIILSRVHHHLMIWGWLAVFYPDRQRFEAASTFWLRNEPTAAGLVSLEVERRNKGFYSFPGPSLTLTALPGEQARETIQPGQLTVYAHPSGPRLRDAEGKDLCLYLPLADFTAYPPFAALAHPLVLHAPIASSAAETPRIHVGSVVYQRRRWRVDLSNIKRLHGLDLALEVWRLKRLHGWPRFLFARSPVERKPWLFDVASPFAHELTKNMLHNDSMATLEEMLPQPDQLWLQDEQGQRYTSELRVQAHRFSQSAQTALERPL